MVDRIVTYMGASFPFFSGSTPVMILEYKIMILFVICLLHQ